VRDPILIADPSVREIQPLARNIAIRVGSIIGRQPVTNSDLIGTYGGLVSNSPGLNENLFCPV
jgi:hypothetical protein